MPTSIATIQINAPLAEVYRYIATPHLLSEWVDGLQPGKRVGGDGEIKMGMRASDHTQIVGAPPGSDPEITAFAPDQSVSMRIESAGFIMQTRFHLFESDGVTTLRQSVKLSYKRWYKLFAMITNRSVDRHMNANLARLKTLVEGEARAKGRGRAA